MTHLAALLLVLLTPASAHGSCATIQKLPEHANDRGAALDRQRLRQPRTSWARAENVHGVRKNSKPLRYGEIHLPCSQHEASSGCKAVASAVGHDGETLLGNGDQN
jgi:hypothetical protein